LKNIELKNIVKKETLEEFKIRIMKSFGRTKGRKLSKPKVVRLRPLTSPLYGEIRFVFRMVVSSEDGEDKVVEKSVSHVSEIPLNAKNIRAETMIAAGTWKGLGEVSKDLLEIRSLAKGIKYV